MLLGCSSLTYVEIPSNVTSIGVSAFERCTGLYQIDMTESVMSIGYEAFRECESLSYVNFYGTSTEFLTIDEGNGYLTDATWYYMEPEAN